jgi:hypothetical protein
MRQYPIIIQWILLMLNFSIEFQADVEKEQGGAL